MPLNCAAAWRLGWMCRIWPQLSRRSFRENMYVQYSIWGTEPHALARRLRDGFELIARKAGGRGVEIDPQEFANRSLLTTSCGLGPATVQVADRALQVLAQAGEILKLN
ncbi:MAG: hypothetical protein JXA78_06385 [Anaerolineales bacterium]|nr:hypothetical protein [Anaerolineales bacterium]